MNIHQCHLAPLAQLPKGQDRNIPDSRNSQERGQTVSTPRVSFSAAQGRVARTYFPSYPLGLFLPSAPGVLCDTLWSQDISVL